MGWTPALVMARVEECVRVIARLPAPRAPGWHNLWPEIIPEFADLVGQRPLPRRPLPTPDAISRADQVLDWLAGLPPDDARALWKRAEGRPWREVAAVWGVCPRTARWRMRVLLTRLAARLEAEGVPVGGRPRRRAA